MIKLFFLCTLFFTCNLTLADTVESKSDLRTFFTTTHTRNELDLLRNQGKFNKSTQTSSTAVLRKPITVKLQGVVLRENKKPVVFINEGNTIESGTIDNGISVSTNNVNKQAYKVPVRVNQQRINIKPGQQWNETDRHVQDNYQIKPTKDKTSENDDTTDKEDN